MKSFDPHSPLVEDTEFSRNLNIRTIRLASKISQLLQRDILNPSDIPVQEFRILISLARRGASHLRKLARNASMDPALVSRTVTKMEKKGWLTRQSSREDGRLVVFMLTDVGADVVRGILPKMADMEKRVSSIFPAKNLDQFIALLDSALDNVDVLLGTDNLK